MSELAFGAMRLGKTTEMHRQLGKQVHDACGGGGARQFIVATPKGAYRVRITKMRKPKPAIRGWRSQ